jgi:hypothetical protein
MMPTGICSWCWLENPGGPVTMDTACVSSTVLSTLKLLHGVHDDQGVLSLPANWAVENPETFRNFFTPERTTFAIAAEVIGANLAAFVPGRRLDFEEDAEVVEVKDADEE